MEVYRYNLSQGIWQPGRETTKDGYIDPTEMLNRILAMNHKPISTKRKLFLLEHFDMLMENRDSLILTKLRLINDYSSNQYTVILIGRPYFQLPEIIDDIPKVHIPNLDNQDIQDLIHTCQKDLSKSAINTLAKALAGLTYLECENLLSLSLAKKNRLDSHFINNEKALLLSQRARGLIELCKLDDDLSQVGGLDVLKEWLLKRGTFIKRKDAKKYKKALCPKGVLLTGPPGCGKSFLVSALAGSWKRNLIRLDPSRVFSSLVGQTEQNFRTALDTVKSLAPCILWIDEFEKFFPHLSNSNSDGGVLSRVLGLFLDFLQARRDGVFVCATTNTISALPQEIVRSGRFDAIFFVDLPNRQERDAILKVVFNKYGLKEKVEVTQSILDATEDFSGAEIEQAILEGFYEYDNPDKEINEFTLLRIIKRMIPLAVTMEEKISAMREWCFSRARFASYPENQNQKERRKLCHILPK